MKLRADLLHIIEVGSQLMPLGADILHIIKVGSL